MSTTIWPGEFFEVEDPEITKLDYSLALEPRIDANQNLKNIDTLWPTPAVVQSISGKIRIPNHTDFPIVLKRNEHIAQISSAYIPVQAASQQRQNKSLCSTNKQTTLFSNNISIDPNKILSPDTITTFKRLHKEFDHVFSNILKGYNGAV